MLRLYPASNYALLYTNLAFRVLQPLSYPSKFPGIKQRQCENWRQVLNESRYVQTITFKKVTWARIIHAPDVQI